MLEAGRHGWRSDWVVAPAIGASSARPSLRRTLRALADVCARLGEDERARLAALLRLPEARRRAIAAILRRSESERSVLRTVFALSEPECHALAELLRPIAVPAETPSITIVDPSVPQDESEAEAPSVA